MKEAPGFYKGYDIEWLRKQEDHSDFALVAEYDAKHAPKEDDVEDEEEKEERGE